MNIYHCDTCNKEADQIRAREDKVMWENQTKGGFAALCGEEEFDDFDIWRRGTEQGVRASIRIVA